MNAIAYKLLTLQPDTDYSPVWRSNNPQVTEDPNRNYPGTYNNRPVFRLLVNASNSTGEVKMWALGNDEPVTIPAAALKAGECYDIYLKKYQLTGGANVTFTGFMCKNMPTEI